MGVLMEKPRTVAELADFLGVSEKTVYKNVAAGLYPHSRLPGSGSDARRLIRFTEEHVRQILSADERVVV